jgi:hypothetical protein
VTTGPRGDIGPAQPAAAGLLNGTSVPPPVLKRRECGIWRIWAIEMGPHWQDPAAYLTPGFRLVHQWQLDGGAMRLWLYQRTQPCHTHATSPPQKTTTGGPRRATKSGRPPEQAPGRPAPPG